VVSTTDFESRLNRLDISLFEGILSGTSEQDRQALLELQRAMREAFGKYVYLEIGSHLGGSIQPHLVDPRCTRIYSIDKRPAEQPDERGVSFPYPNNSTEKMLKLLTQVSPSDMHKVVTLDADASEIDLEVIDEPPQFCFIDGEHTNRAVISDFEFCSRVCAPNALIAFHDINIVGEGIKTILRSLHEKNIKHSAVHVGGVVFAIGLGDVELSSPGVAIPSSDGGHVKGNWVLEPDPVSLAGQMRHVFDNPEQARVKGRAGHAYVQNHLTWAHAADKVQERLYALREKPILREMSLDMHISLSPNIPIQKNATPARVFIWAGGGDGARCLKSIQDHPPAGSRSEVLVDDTVAKALNSHLAGLTEPYLAIVRNDVVVTEDWLQRLGGHLDRNADIAAVVPMLPTQDTPQYLKPGYKNLDGELKQFSAHNRDGAPGDLVNLTEIQSACVIVRTDMARLFGGFDGSFKTPAFLSDFVRRCLQTGKRVVCAQDVFVHCEKALISAAEEQENSAVERLIAGDISHAAGDAETALLCYEQALEFKPDYLEATLIYTAVLLETNRAGEAADIFEKMVEEYPRSSRLRNYYGRCLFVSGKRSQSRAEFEKSIELDPNFGEAYGNLAVLLWEDGILDDALDKMNRAAELSPQSPDVIYNIGMIYAQLGQGKMAIEMLEHYLSMTPGDLYAKTYLAVLLLENEAEEKGISILEEILAVDPQNTEALRVLTDLQSAVETGGSDG
jgi:tetratricopeptide (TPR) repeat protein